MSYIDILPTAQAGGFPLSPRGFPVSTRRARFGFHRPSAGFKYRESHGMDVLRGIEISLVLGATFGAHPFTDSKRKGVEDMSTGKATFRRGIPLVNLHQVPPVPLRFVFQLGHKLTPPHVTDRFTQLVVLEHVLH